MTNQEESSTCRECWRTTADELRSRVRGLEQSGHPAFPLAPSRNSVMQTRQKACPHVACTASSRGSWHTPHTPSLPASTSSITLSRALMGAARTAIVQISDGIQIDQEFMPPLLLFKVRSAELVLTTTCCFQKDNKKGHLSWRMGSRGLAKKEVWASGGFLRNQPGASTTLSNMVSSAWR